MVLPRAIISIIPYCLLKISVLISENKMRMNYNQSYIIAWSLENLRLISLTCKFHRLTVVVKCYKMAIDYLITH